MDSKEQIIRLKWKCTTDIRKLFVSDKEQFVREYFDFQKEIKKTKKGSRLGLSIAILFLGFYLFQFSSGATEVQLNLSMWMTLLFLLMWVDSSNKRNNLEMLEVLEKMSNDRD